MSLPMVSFLLSSKQVNVMTKRAVLVSEKDSVDWSHFLSRLDKLYAGVLVATHVCQVSFDYVC